MDRERRFCLPKHADADEGWWEVGSPSYGDNACAREQGWGVLICDIEAWVVDQLAMRLLQRLDIIGWYPNAERTWFPIPVCLV